MDRLLRGLRRASDPSGRLAFGCWPLAGAVCVALLCATPATGYAATAPGFGCDIDPQVDTRVDGDAVEVQVRLLTPAPRSVVWDVMTDYAGATRFIRHLQRSDAVVQAEGKIQVQQVGRVSWGPLRADIVTDYEVQLQREAWRLTGRLTRGDVQDLWLGAELKTHPDGTELVYRNRVVPAIWMPLSMAAPMLDQRARESFADLKTEIHRRAALCLPAPTP